MRAAGESKGRVAMRNEPQGRTVLWPDHEQVLDEKRFDNLRNEGHSFYCVWVELPSISSWGYMHQPQSLCEVRAPASENVVPYGCTDVMFSSCSPTQMPSGAE